MPEWLCDIGYEGWFELFGDWRRIEQLDIATMHRASPSPAEFTVSHPYIFSFYFVPTERRSELACLARLATGQPTVRCLAPVVRKCDQSVPDQRELTTLSGSVPHQFVLRYQ